MRVGFLQSDDIADAKKFAKKFRVIAAHVFGPGVISESDELWIWSLRANAIRVGRNPLALFVWNVSRPVPDRRYPPYTDYERGSRDRNSVISGRRRHRRFLESNEWWHIRRWKLKKCGFRCERCGERFPGRDLDIHHKHYNRPWGTERAEDLEVLCRTCHGRQHGLASHPVKGWSWIGESIQTFNP